MACGAAGRERGRQLPSVEVADPVGADQAVGLGRAEGPEGFRQRHGRVVVVREVQVDLVHAQPVQARAELPGDPVRLQAVVRAGLHRVERLGGEPRPDPARPDPAADRLLTAPAAVGVGRVEMDEAGFPGRVHQRERLILGQPLAEELRCRADAAEVAAAERDPCDGEPRHSTPLRQLGVNRSMANPACAGRCRHPVMPGRAGAGRRGRQASVGGWPSSGCWTSSRPPGLSADAGGGHPRGRA